METRASTLSYFYYILETTLSLKNTFIVFLRQIAQVALELKIFCPHLSRVLRLSMYTIISGFILLTIIAILGVATVWFCSGYLVLVCLLCFMFFCF